MLRTPGVTTESGASLASFRPGPLAVSGLCFDCNNLTSGKADPAYIDFHKQVERYLRPSMRRILVEPTDVHARISPGLVG